MAGEQTILLAQFLGVASLVIGLSMLVRQKMVMKIFDDVFTNRALAYLLGLVEFAGGLLLVLYHNIWSPALAAVITVLGWLLLIEGALYLFVTKRFLKELVGVLHKRGVFALMVAAYLLLGAYLTYASFGF